jgi:O-antigen ligase
LAPAALFVALALAGGGFDVTGRHIAGLVVWLVVVALLVLGAGSRARLAWPLYVGTGLIVGLALLSALSSLWSGSMELSVIEADRVLVYLGFFLAAFLIAQTDESRQRFAEGMALGITLVVLLGLFSRLLPHVMNVSDSLGSGPRLRYPLGYWNANGAMAGIAVAMLLWTSRRSAWAALRWLSAAAIPAVLLTLYFAYSRGGLLALAVAVGCLLALSRDRLWLLGTLAIGALGALPAILAVQARGSLADNLDRQASVDQGLTVFLILLAGIAGALLLYGLLRAFEARGGERLGRVVAFSRHPALLGGIAAALAIAAIAVVAAVGGRAWDQFSSPDIQFPDDPAQHFSQLSGAGRHDFFRVAIDAFEEEPAFGIGAGAYEFAWEEHRSIDLSVIDAHSLYLEAFAELGVIGGLLVLFLVGSMLWCGFAAWRAAPYPQREAYAALLAAMLAFAIGAGIDWFWEIADVAAVFFLAAGVLVGVRCSQLAGAAEGRSGGRRWFLAVAGLAAAWISAAALIGPLLVEREIKQSQTAAADGDLASAFDHASNARSIAPWAASPYLQLGLLAELEGEYAASVEYLSDAIDREDHDWQLYYLRARVFGAAADAATEAGETALARKYRREQASNLREAKRLNPRAPELAAVGG